MKLAQTACNAYIRARDEGKPCICCGKPDNGETRHAGHFLHASSHPELRFEPENIHACCVKCNVFLSGNLIPYRAELIKRIGIDRVEWLEGPHTVTVLTIDEIKAVTAKYKAMKKEIEQ